MPEILDFFGQKWATDQPGELTLFLNHAGPGADRTSLSIEMQFYPPWKLEEDEEDLESQECCRILHLSAQASMPAGVDWPGLHGMKFEADEGDGADGEVIVASTRAPDVDVYSYGHGPLHVHLKNVWDSTLAFGHPDTGDPHVLPFEVSAFAPSDRARAASSKLIKDEVAEMFGEYAPPDFESQQLLKDGRWLHFAGHCRLDQVFCVVPVNAADPIGHAQAMARQKLNLTEWGFRRVNGGDTMLGTFQPQDGVQPHGGRLVVLSTMSEWYRRNGARMIADARERAAREAAKNPPPSGEGKTAG